MVLKIVFAASQRRTADAVHESEENAVHRPATQGRTDPDLLGRLQRGEERAWEQLLRDWQVPLYRFLCASLPSPDHAQDVLGDTMEALVGAIRRFDGNVALSTFIYSIATRKVADYWRKNGPVQEIPETLGTRGPSSDSLVFRDVLAHLQPQYREALLLRYHMGLSVSEVAEAIGRTYKATESLLSRGRQQLEEDLGRAGFQL